MMHIPFESLKSTPRRVITGWFLGVVLLLMSFGWASNATAQNGQVDQEEINKMVDAAVGYLRTRVEPKSTGGHASLVGYALIKGGVPPTDPLIAGLVQGVRNKVKDSVYKPRNHHLYEAGVDLMFLEAAGKSKYRTEMEAIVKFVERTQITRGGWFYLDRELGKKDGGDTSITQYAILGLWAAQRAGVDVPLAVLDKAAAYHVATQLPAGGFAYHPKAGPKQTVTMTTAGTGSMLILRRLLHPDADDLSSGAEQKKGSGKFGVLQQVDLDSTDRTGAASVAEQNRNYTVRTSLPKINSVASKGLKAMNATFTFEGDWPMYKLYSLERTASLANLQTIQGQNWYLRGAQLLKRRQGKNGSWKGHNLSRDDGATAFGVLFLVRATGKTIGRSIPGAGDGLMMGGRGLPDDLSQAALKNGEVQEQKVSGPLDQLLAELSKADALDEVNVDTVQQAIVEKVQLGDREALIGEKERLLTLIDHPAVEVRRTAYWALGRCEDLKLAGTLIAGLEDPDLGVAVEARNALCILTRQPSGLGEADDPLAGFEGAGENEKLARANRWRQDAQTRWQRWYNRIRPYETRDDINELIPDDD